MHYMFDVRSARALAPSLQLGPLPVHTTCAAAVLRTPASRLAPVPASHARLSTRQSADAFNQPLSFDTSSVTNMIRMFNVRSARALWPPALSRALPVHAACVTATPNALTPPGPHLAAHRMPALRLGSPRTHSTKRSASTCPASQTRTTCSPCAPRVPRPPPALSHAGHLPACTLRALPSLHALAPRIIACSLLSTRQGTSGGRLI